MNLSFCLSLFPLTWHDLRVAILDSVDSKLADIRRGTSRDLLHPAIPEEDSMNLLDSHFHTQSNIRTLCKDAACAYSLTTRDCSTKMIYSKQDYVALPLLKHKKMHNISCDLAVLTAITSSLL